MDEQQFYVEFTADIGKWQSDLETVKKTLADFRSGVLTADEAVDQIGSSVSKTSKSMRDFGDSLGESAKTARTEFGRLWQEIQEGQKEMRKGLRADVVDSSGGSIGWGGGSMELDQAKNIIAAYEARGKTALQAARETVQAHDQEAKSLAALNAAAVKQDVGIGQRDAHVKAFEERNKQIGIASQQTALYNQYLYDEEKAAQRAAGATNTLTGATKNTADSLPRLRYALYDISNTLAIFGAAALAAAAAPVAIATSWERSFADVRRTVDGSTGQLNRLEDEFIGLAKSIPVSFSTLSEIGSLAGQLNVPMAQMSEFTELVAKFSATTDVSVEQSATAFARLTELLPPLEGGFNALGSSILNVGINSIATESQIIAISTQIAGIASQAGLTADEVFGLSAAIASMGIQPELARGTITRLFGQIGRAVSQGGTRLEDFGKIARMSGDQFAEAWDERPMEAVLAFLDGIGNKEGPAAEAALRALGISSVRDVPAILRLSQNLDLVKDNLDDAAIGAEEGAELNRQYGIIANTVSEQLKVLTNNFQALMNALGDQSTGPLAGIISGMTNLLKILSGLASSPVFGWVAVVGVGLTALIGTVLLLGAAFARALASAAAMSTAMKDLGLSSIFARGAMTQVIGQIVGVDVASKGATIAVRTLSMAMRALGVAGAVVATIGVGVAVAEWWRGFSGGRVDVEYMTNAIQTAGDEMVDFSDAIDSVARSASGGLSRLTTDWAEDIIGLGTLGNNLTAQLSSFVDDLTGIDNAVGPMKAVGELEQAFIDAFKAGDQIAAIDAFRQLEQDVLDAGGSQEALNTNFEEFLDLIDTVDYDKLVATAEIEQAAADFDLLKEEIDDIIDSITTLQRISLDLEGSLRSLGQSFADNGPMIRASTEGGAENLEALLSTIEAIAAKTPGDVQATANNLQGLFNTIVDGGYAAAHQLGFLSDMISQLGGANGDATISFASLGRAYNNTTKAAQSASKAVRGSGGAARSAAKEVRTLVDYANDLSKVFGRAFDIQFGPQTAMDNITLKWIELNEQLRDYRAEVARLQSDRAITEYFLSIAEAYDDQLRAGQLRADLLEIDGKLADAQANVSRETVGNSKAAIQNRGTLEDLVKQYSEYITALAASGADQSELNAAVATSQREFSEQARALGFADSQLTPYMNNLRGLTTVIDRIPRNITVTANMNPAIQALNEFEAAAKRAGANAGGYLSEAANKAARAARIQAAISYETAFIKDMENRAVTRPALAYQYQKEIEYARARINQLVWALQSGSYASGGYTGDGGMYQPAGVVHKGEFVFSKKATANLGVGQLSAMHAAAKSGRGFATGGPVSTPLPSNSGGMMVELSPTDRRLLAAAGNVTLTLDGRIVADSTNTVNGVYAKRGA